MTDSSSSKKNKSNTIIDSNTEKLEQTIKDLQKQCNDKDELLHDAYKQIDDLNDALKKSSFVPANAISPEEYQKTIMENTKLKMLLAVRSINVDIDHAGKFTLYSDPVKKVLELRDAREI